MKEYELKTYYTTSRPMLDEREVLINIFQDEDGEWIAELETCIQKYDNKCRKKGWVQKSVTLHKDGSWVSSVWVAPAYAVNIGNAVKVKRVMTEEQRQAAAQRLARARENRKLDDEEGDDFNDEDDEEDLNDD